MILLFTCQSQQPSVKQQVAETQILPQDSVICPDDIERSADSIPPNLFSPKQRENICGGWIPEDTLTAGGNHIKYLITNDICCRYNLYIAWGNKYMERTEAIPALRTFHAKMIPDFLAETKEAIYLPHIAAIFGAHRLKRFNLAMKRLSCRTEKPPVFLQRIL